MLEKLIKQFNYYRLKAYHQYGYFYKRSFKFSRSLFGNSKKHIEIQKLNISLKKYYYYLGKYVAKQYISKGYSDFSLDGRFKSVNKDIKEALNAYENLKKKEQIKK